ncbi:MULTISPECIES: leucyl aminopeptidase [unclassified Rothia (in: high G+C Gram-positive bacteria)]|uniref:leucyl aminopeptidase n=1 Tax=unclassified Rothia (in: high G+C Gram-positive bacteria) TaxID=2689056 RepID=UPI00195EC84A|nr:MULTISPECIES: leucyl aminopeptidase [unclassified Rothia (in: high G+C Gram-positive bacteria)]MBM7050719.1 leucyl aminopeptidase [Rothia sp. ZJ1223]QRZ60904.1 leucyl aminopeptidase [Rothia sp. ZJ932]
MSELTLSVSSKDLESLEADALVLGVYSHKEGAYLADSSLSDETRESIESVLDDLGITGSADQVYRLPGIEDVETRCVVLTGLGTQHEDALAASNALRYGVGSAVRQLAGIESIIVDVPVSSTEDLAAVAEGIALGAFTDAQLKVTSADSVKQPVSSAVILTDISVDDAEAALERALVLGEAVHHTRVLVNTPPSHLYPETFAQAAQDRVEGLSNVSVRVFEPSELEAEGFGGIMGVGRGSERGPRFVEVKYAPSDAKSTVALVGKGITFDSGGLSIKPGAAMMTMKCDMAGAASVLNAVAAVAELKLPVAVTAYLCLAENMPSGTATRPEDVLTMRGGTTVEVLNTDAEGRLVMADGLAYASEQNPDVILDVATLTGAQMIALGTRTSAVMGDESVRQEVVEAARAAGEDFWPMPMPAHLRSGLNSQVADLKNIGSRFGGMLSAGLFLKEFVGSRDEQSIPWAHLDIASPAFNEESPFGFTPKEGTGHSVATLLAFVEARAQG